MTAVHALPALKNLPQGVQLVEAGSTEFITELFDGFALAIVAGILMVFAVLVLLFVRVFQPITILSALPLSLGGAVLALLLTNVPFSLPVVIGILMLMGIVAKNSILLVDFAIEEMRAGKTRLQAILESGHKRARPIVMTTVAMVAGMIPVAAGWGGDSDFRAPMAIAVIGGLITSTLLTLVIVPAVFTVFDDIERWVGPKAAFSNCRYWAPVLPHWAVSNPNWLPLTNRLNRAFERAVAGRTALRNRPDAFLPGGRHRGCGRIECCQLGSAAWLRQYAYHGLAGQRAIAGGRPQTGRRRVAAKSHRRFGISSRILLDDPSHRPDF
jgi:hypothetical protein